MLPDAALRSIADNLAALRLDPLLHLKIAAAIVAPLMEGNANQAPPKPHSPSRKAAPSKKAKARKGNKPEAIPIAYDGKIFPSRGAMAKHLAPILGKSVATLTRALIDPATTPRRSFAAISPPRKKSLVPR
jgi:hypothetical protein